MAFHRRRKSFMRDLGCAFISRNNDFNGYWLPGILCKFHCQGTQSEFQFIIDSIDEQSSINIAGINLNHITDALHKNIKRMKLIGLKLSIHVSFCQSTKEPVFGNNLIRYIGTLTISLFEDNSSAVHLAFFECWPHDPLYEMQSTRATA